MFLNDGFIRSNSTICLYKGLRDYKSSRRKKKKERKSRPTFNKSVILDRGAIMELKILNKTIPKLIKKFKDFGLKAQ